MFKRQALFALLAFQIVGLQSLPAVAENILPKNWQSRHFTAHPLVGKAMTGDGRETRISQIALAAQVYKYVLIGEQHDNPDHHLIQAALIKSGAARGRKPGVVFEMVPRTYAREVSKYNLQSDPLLDDFAKRLDWEKRGWNSWTIYRAVGLAAAENKLPMHAGTLPREMTRKISRQGIEQLSTGTRRSYGLTFPLEEPLSKSLLNELGSSHCGLMPANALPSMLNVQRAQDGSLARAMIDAGGLYGSILIAGNGHVRKDRGVPWYLRKLLPGSFERKVTEKLSVRVPNAHSVSIGLIEVDPSLLRFAEYNLMNEQAEPKYDFVIFTPKFDTKDHCADLRKQMKKQ